MKKVLLILTTILTSVSAVWAEDYSQGYYTMSPGAGNTYFGFYSSNNANSKYSSTQTRESAVVFTFEKTGQEDVYYWYDCNNKKYIYSDASGYLQVSDNKETNNDNYKWYIKENNDGTLTIADMTTYNNGNPISGLIQLYSVSGWWASKCSLTSSDNQGKNTWKLNLLMKKNTPYYISFRRYYGAFNLYTTYRYLQYESSSTKMKQSEANNKDASRVWYIKDAGNGAINLFAASDANAMGYASNASAESDKISTTNPVKSIYLRQSDNSDYPIAFLTTAENNTLYISNFGGKDTQYLGLYGTLADDGTRMKVEEAIKYDVVVTKPQSLTETPTVTCNLTGYSGQVVQNGGSIYIGMGNTLTTDNLTISNYPYYKYTVSINDYVITVKYSYHPNREGITIPEGCNGYIGGITDISETEWKTQEYWSLSDNWNDYGPGCSVSGSAQGMWKPIYLQGITGGTVPALDGWNFRMVADHSTYTIASVGKIQFEGGLSSYLTLKNTSVVTMNMGSGQANPFIVNLDEGTNNELNFVMSNGFNSEITVNYGTVSEDMNRKFNASGTGTISTLNLNATIEGTIESDELTCHSVVLGRINSTPTDNITAANFTRTTGVLTASNDNIGKYSVVKDGNGDVTLYWVTGPLLTVLTNAYAGARNINDGFLTVNDNSSTISKNDNGDIVIYNVNGFNNNTDAGSSLTTISFRITLDNPTSFTKIFTYSVTNDWTTEDGKVGIGLTSDCKLKGLWNGSEWSPSTGALISDVIPAGTHIITVALGQSDNSNGTRIYVDDKSTFYSATGLKTSYATYKYILINSTIANSIDALYVYNYALSSTAVGNVMSAINALPSQVNEKCYIIKGHSNNSLNVYYDGTNDYVRINTTSGNNDNYKWSIYTIDEKSFLYNIGAGKFVCQVSGTSSSTRWPLKAEEAYDMTITKNESTNEFNCFTIRSKFCKGNQDYLHYNSTYTYGSTNWSDDADDSKWRIIEVGELTQEQQQTIKTAFENAHLSEAQVNTAKENIKTGVGYPKTTTETYLTLNSLTTSTKVYNNGSVVDIDDLVSAYKVETDIQLPEDGKAYYIINGQYNSSGEMEANRYVLYNSNDKMSIKAYSAETLDESCIWVVRKIEDGYYALVSATGNGGYIHWTNNTDENRSLVTTYSKEDNNNKTKMHIAKIVHTSNVIPTNAQLFGYLSLRGYRAVNNGSDSPLIFKGASAGFDSTIEDIVRYTKENEISQFSTAVQFVEATDYTANQVSLKAPKKTDGKTYSSIYLPYPVKVPEGVTAYYCTLNENSLHLNEIGNKIPAQTGAILIGGTEASTQILVPATTETASENVSDNVLSGVLSNTLTSNLGSRIYVLNGGQSAGIGFYPYSQLATLTAYKAYYNASSLSARDFYLFGLDDESATGIEDLSEDIDNKNDTFASGRKVLLQDGRIVIVKEGKKYSVTGQIYK